MLNHFGKDSELYIKTKELNGVTILEDAYFTAPYKIAKPFFDDGKNMMNIMVMSASAGIMEGDCYRVAVELGSGSRTALQGQSYNKIHRMYEGYASQSNKFFLEENAFFDYVQKPTIPFADSSFRSTLECHLKRGSSFLYSEVLACGRVKRGECFQFKEYKNCNRVYYNEDLIFLDNQLLIPACQSLGGIGFFEGFTHQATLGYFYDGINDNLLDTLFIDLEKIKDIEFGLTKTKKIGIVARILGNSSDTLERALSSLREKVYNLSIISPVQSEQVKR